MTMTYSYLSEAGSSTPDQKQHHNLNGEHEKFGGSQHSLNSTNTVTSSGVSTIDDPEHFSVQKQRKDLVEEGIKR